MKSRGGRAVAGVLLLLALFVLAYFAGDYMLAAVLEPMWREGVIPGNTETWRIYAGLLKTLPGYIGLALLILWGALADRLGRPKLILLLGLSMAASLALVSASTTYLLLLAAFTVFGAAKTWITPVLYAFIPDIVPPEKRGAGYAAYYTPSVLGFILGVILGGVLLYWRTAYLLTAAATGATVLLLYLASRDTRIGGAEHHQAATQRYRFREALRSTLDRTVLILTLQVIPWTIPWGFITLFAVDYFTTVWHITRTTASMILAAAAITIALGHILGGILGDKASAKNPAARPLIAALGVALGYTLTTIALNYPVHDEASLITAATLAALGLMAATTVYPNLSTVISDSTPPIHRGTVFAIYNILNTLGWATGPILYGILASTLTATLPQQTALRYTATILLSLWLISLAAWLAASKTYKPRS